MNVIFLFRNLKAIAAIAAIAALAIGMSACAALPGSGGNSWKEEVQLRDGGMIIAQRAVELGGRREIEQLPPIRSQTLTFTMPGTGQTVVWEDPYSIEVCAASFLPMLLEIDRSVAYLVVYPMGCLSYNKWGRPNPPYVVFKYQRNKWDRIPLEELPAAITKPNLIFSSPDIQAKEAGQPVVSAATIRRL